MPKLGLAGVTAIFGATPAPNSGTVNGSPVAYSVIVSEADRPPLAAGVNVTFIVVLAPGARVTGNAAEKAKSAAFAPVIVICEIVTPMMPLLVITTG